MSTDPENIIEPERVPVTYEMMETTIWAQGGHYRTGLGEGHPTRLDVMFFDFRGKSYTLVSPFMKGENIKPYAYRGVQPAEMCLSWFLDEY